MLVLIVIIFMFFLDNKKSEITLNYNNLSLIILCLIGILVFITSNNLFVLYLGIELQSLALYTLCCLKRYSNKSLEAGFKYFLYGSFSSVILLFGLSLIYGSLGSLNLKEVHLLITIINYDSINCMILQVGLLCLLVGFLFKLAIFPFH